MTDFIGEIKRNMACTLHTILDIACDETNVSCPANDYAAKTALPLIHNTDASLWQTIINDKSHEFTLWGIEYVDSVDIGGGHLLFNFSESLYVTIVERMLNELPPVSFEWSMEHANCKALERTIYAKHRMRMLARRSGQDTSDNAKTLYDNECFTFKSIQSVIILVAALIEPGIGKRALELRLNETANALLTMTHCVAPRERAKFSKDCSLVAEAALRALHLAINTSE